MRWHRAVKYGRCPSVSASQQINRYLLDQIGRTSLRAPVVSPGVSWTREMVAKRLPRLVPTIATGIMTTRITDHRVTFMRPLSLPG
jgi:hypothetical protein